MLDGPGFQASCFMGLEVEGFGCRHGVGIGIYDFKGFGLAALSFQPKLEVPQVMQRGRNKRFRYLLLMAEKVC